MYLIQVLLPLKADGSDDTHAFDKVRTELTSRFGGMTFYRNAPAEGLWENDRAVEKDAIVMAEVMAEEIDRAWWSDYRIELERRFAQNEILIRALPATRL